MVSHPTWVRGLKPIANWIALLAGLVAPHVGAWIETFVDLFMEME